MEIFDLQAGFLERYQLQCGDMKNLIVFSAFPRNLVSKTSRMLIIFLGYFFSPQTKNRLRLPQQG